jgi:hypothetical protein
MQKVGNVQFGHPRADHDILWDAKTGEVQVDGLPVGWAGDAEDAERAALHFVRYNEKAQIEHELTSKETA